MKLLTQISLALFGILAGNYSGITHLGGNQYAIVDDKDRTDGFKVLELDIDSLKGKVLDARLIIPEGLQQRRHDGSGVDRDCEGVAFCDATGTVFVSGENDQRIVEYDLAGFPTGRELAVPPLMQSDKIVANYGFEALTYCAATGRFWTTTESTLKADGEAASLKKKHIANRLQLQSFDSHLKASIQLPYLMDLPTAKGKQGTYAHGVPAMTALDDGRLIVMEREAFVANGKIGSFCRVKLYVVDTSEVAPINDATDLQNLPHDRFLTKTLLTEFTTRLNLTKMNFANYEGMCLGPRLADGRQTLILIADSQGGAGNKLFRLKDRLRIVAF